MKDLVMEETTEEINQSTFRTRYSSYWCRWLSFSRRTFIRGCAYCRITKKTGITERVQQVQVKLSWLKQFLSFFHSQFKV